MSHKKSYEIDFAYFSEFTRKLKLSVEQVDDLENNLNQLIQELSSSSTHPQVTLSEHKKKQAAFYEIAHCLEKITNILEGKDLNEGYLTNAVMFSQLSGVFNKEFISQHFFSDPETLNYGVSKFNFLDREFLLNIIKPISLGFQKAIEVNLPRKGRPRNWERQIALSKIYSSYISIYDRYDKLTPSAELLQFFHSCFAAIDISTEGLDDAAARFLKRYRWALAQDEQTIHDLTDSAEIASESSD